MNKGSITPAANTQRLKGFALACVVGALMLSLLLEALDQTIVGTAMPRITAELHGLDRYTWVVTAYILASMIMIPLSGKLSDLFGRKWFLLVGTALFLVGSLLAGVAQTMDQLIIFRAIQGLGSGIGIALIATVFGDLFPPAERAKWASLFGLVYGISNLFGPTLGGWLAEHGPLVDNLINESSRWRWVFYINLPLGLLALVALTVYLPANISVRTSTLKGWASIRRIDFAGAIISAAATICLMLGLTWGSNQMFAWNSPQVLGLLVAGVILFGLFLFVESKATEPLLPLNLFRNQVFSVASLLSMLQMMVLLGLSLYLPLYLQGVLAVSPTSAGLVITPLSLSMVVGAMVAGPLISAFKRYQLIAIVGAVLMVAGTFLLTLMSPETGLFEAIIFMILAGLGTGVFFPIQTVAQNVLPPERLGVGTSAVRYLGQLGASLGIAIVGTVVSSGVRANLTQQLPADQSGKLQLSDALQHGFVAILVFAVIVLVATCFLKDVPFSTTTEEEPASEAETSQEIISVS